MRSTGFVIVSILVHIAAVAAVALSPRQISEFTKGSVVEVTLGEANENPGVEEAKGITEVPPAAAATTAADTAPVEPAKAQPVKAEPEVAPAPVPQPVAEVKPVKKPTPVPVKAQPRQARKLPKKVKVQTAQVAPAPIETPAEETAEAELPAKQSPPEKLDPVLDETKTEDQEVALAPAPATEPEPQPEVAAAPAPAPAPTPAPAAPKQAQLEDHETEATSSDINHTEDPSPVGVTEENPSGAATTGALSKGGSTEAGAVEFTNLKQMNGNRAPIYPLAARRERRQGEVELLYRVTKEGQVADVKVAKSSGSQDLDAEAVRAISKFHFIPGQEGWAKHPVNFTLTGETAALPSRLRTKVGSQE